MIPEIEGLTFQIADACLSYASRLLSAVESSGSTNDDANERLRMAAAELRTIAGEFYMLAGVSVQNTRRPLSDQDERLPQPDFD